MQLEMFPELEESSEEEKENEPTLAELEEMHGVFPGSPGWTEEMESKRKKMIKELDMRAHILLRYQDGHHERCAFYGHENIQGIKLGVHGNIFNLEKLRKLGVRFIHIEYNKQTICINNPKCVCPYEHAQTMQGIKTNFPKLDLEDI